MSTPASEAEAAGLGPRLLHAYSGPNPYADEPCVVAALNIPSGIESEGRDKRARIADACSRWFAPPPQDADGDEATAAFLASLSLALLNREGGMLRTARGWRENGEPRLCVGSHVVPVTMAAIRLSTEILTHIDTATPAELDRQLERFWQSARAHHPDFQVRFLMQAARAEGLPFLPYFPGHRLWQFGWGVNGRVFFESEPEDDSAIGWKIARDKTASKAIFAALGVRVPPHVLAHGEADLPAAAETIGWPCVVKPAAAGAGKGVTTDVDGMDLLTRAFREARSLGKGPVMIERQVEGDVHRINVVRGTVTVIRRFSVEVAGDGERSVAELIEAANREIEERRAIEPYRGTVVVDDKLRNVLRRQGLSLDAVPEPGRKVVLNRIALLARGGSYADATAAAHPDIATMARLLAASFRLKVCGIDYITGDISRSCAEEGTVLEINTTPGLRAAQEIGMSPEEIGRAVLGDGVGRIPVALVVASASDVECLGAELRFTEGQGWVAAGTCGIGSLRLDEPPPPAPRTAALVSRILLNPLAESLTIVCTPEDIAEAGLPIDRYDRAIACPAPLDPRWREVLARRAEAWLEVADAGHALEALHEDQGNRATRSIS